jgi:hypothetical protein
MDREWFEVPGEAGDLPNIESAREVALDAAGRTDRTIEIYRCTRTRILTFTRSVTITAKDVSSA